MEEAMSPTEHSHYGTGDRVKLPNLTDEEVNWQGLEDLYSINESLYELRPDYSPSPDNWANFEKEVDYMFALLLDLNKHNRTQTLDDSTLPELGSGAGGGLDEGSGDLWPAFITEVQTTASTLRTTTPDLSTTLAAAQSPIPLQDSTLRTQVNELPESVHSNPSPSVKLPSVNSAPVWTQLEDIEVEEGFSGNGLTELETRHDHLLRTHNSLQPQPTGQVLRLDEEEDIFQAQGYLPFAPQPVRPTGKASACTDQAGALHSAPSGQTSALHSARTGQTSALHSAGQTSALHSVGAVLTVDFEGSGSSSQPSAQTL